MSIRLPVLCAAAPLKTPQFSSNHVDDNSYILALASTPTPLYAALSAKSNIDSENSIHLYSPSPNGLVRTHTFPDISRSTPSAMRVVHNFCGRSTLLSSHRDPGCIKVWDDRTGGFKPVSEFHSPKRRAILSFDVSSDGNTLAAGTDLCSNDTSIFYWDPRNSAQPMHNHSSTHSDDITVLQFHPIFPDILLSASTDGLLSTSNAREADEDDAVYAVANWGHSVARAGWFAHDAGYSIWAASDMETFGMWNRDLDNIVDFGDIRQPSMPGLWRTDYLIDAQDFSSAPGPCGSSFLTLFLGSNAGDVALVSVSDLSNVRPTWTMKGVLRGGHSDAVVRCKLWDHTNGVLLTGDEAGRISSWSSVVEGDIEMVDVGPSTVGAGVKREREDVQDDQDIKRGKYKR